MSFFTGFATGLAKSVDTQLKESIERTRDNIDMVSKWRLKKAEERERERKSKDKEIQTLIQDAAYVISGNQNDVDAQNIAAALYKERGLSGFTDDINFMKQQKEAGVGVRPIDYLKRANEDVDVKRYGLSEIVRSLSDAESSFAASDMVFPKGTIKGSGLISALVPDFDVTAAGGAQAKEQMQQIGFTTTPTAPSLSFDRYTFDRESLGYATKSVNEKLSYLRNIIDDPTADPELAAKAGERLNELLNKSMTGEEGSAIQAINLQLARLSTQDTSAMSEMQFKAFDTEQSGLIERRQTLEDTISLRDAKTPKERLAIEANIAFREDRMEDGYRLMAESEDYGVQVTNATLIDRIKGRATRLQSETDYINSTGKYVGDGFKEDRARIKTIEANEQALVGIAFDKVEAFRGYISRAAMAEFKTAHPDIYKDLDLSSLRGDDGLIDGNAFMSLLTGKSSDAKEKYDAILNSVAQRYKTIGAQYNVPDGVIDSAIMLLTGKGLPAVGDVAGAGTGAGADEGDAVVTQTDTILDAQEQTTESIDVAKLLTEQVTSLEEEFPSTADGAKNIVASILSDDDTIADVFNITGQLHNSNDEFNKLVEEEVNRVQAAADNAIVGNTSQTPGTMLGVGADVVTINPVKKDTVVNDLATDLGISTAAAETLVDSAVEKVNKPLDQMTAADASTENVMKVLDQEDLIALGGGVAPMRFKRAVSAIASNFNMEPAEAEAALNRALRVTKELKEAQRDPDFAERFKSGTLIGQVDVGEFKPENILTDAFKDVPGDSSDSAPTKFKPSAIQLAMKFIDGTLEGAERSSFRKELTGPNGKELAAAIQMIRDRRKAEQEVSAYRSRGGLMGR